MTKLLIRPLCPDEIGVLLRLCAEHAAYEKADFTQRRHRNAGATRIMHMFSVSADRILYSVDYPYEDVVEAREWFDRASISESDRKKVARTNAQKLFRF